MGEVVGEPAPSEAGPKRPLLPAAAGRAALAEAIGSIILIGDARFQLAVRNQMLEPLGLAPETCLTPSSSQRYLPRLAEAQGRRAMIITDARSMKRLLRQRLRQIKPTTRLIVVIEVEEVETGFLRLERAGVLDLLAGFVTPDRMGEVGPLVVPFVPSRMTVLPYHGLRPLLDEHRRERAIATMDEEEHRLLTFLSRGASDREIAGATQVTIGRVRYLMRNALRKLGCRNRTTAAVLAHNYIASRTN